MQAYLISYASGDNLGVEGADISLLDLEALKDRGVQYWMTDQGFAVENPDECMLLATEPGPSGWESLPVELGDADAAQFREELAKLAEARQDREERA